MERYNHIKDILLSSFFWIGHFDSFYLIYTQFDLSFRNKLNNLFQKWIYIMSYENR